MQKHRNNNVAPIGLSSLRTWIGTPSGWPAIVMPRAWTAWLQLQEDEFEALDDHVDLFGARTSFVTDLSIVICWFRMGFGTIPNGPELSWLGLFLCIFFGLVLYISSRLTGFPQALFRPCLSLEPPAFRVHFPPPRPAHLRFTCFFSPGPPFLAVCLPFLLVPTPPPPPLPSPTPPPLPSPTPLFNSKSMNSVSVLVSGQAEAGGAALGLNGGGSPPIKTRKVFISTVSFDGSCSCSCSCAGFCSCSCCVSCSRS